MSHSENKPKSTQTSSTSVTNLNIQDTEGVTIAGDGNTVLSTDYDAIATAGEISRAALDMGYDSLNIGADLAGRGLDHAFDFGRSTVGDAFAFGDNTVSEAFSFGTRSLDSVTGFADSALQSNVSVSRDAMDFASESLGAVTDFAELAGAGVLDFAQTLVGDTVSGLKDLSMQTSASTDDRVAKVAMYAFAAVAAAIVLPALFKKG